MLLSRLRAAVVLLVLLPPASCILSPVPSGKRLRIALQELAAEDGLCVTTVGLYMGRLSNVVSMVNRVLRMSLQAGASFRFPEKFPEPNREDRLKSEGFEAFFGKEPRCEKHAVRVLKPICAHPSPCSKQDPSSLCGRCFPEDMLEAPSAWHTEESSFCGCTRVVAVNATEIQWDHDYTLTHDILYKRYWSSHGGVPQFSRTKNGGGVQVSVHVRLGDLEYNCSARYNLYNCQKRLGVDAYLAALRALFTVLPPSCAEVNLVTDGTRTSEDIQEISHNVTGKVSALRVYDRDALTALQSFNMLASSDVLVFGASGFGEIAAMLSRPSAARLGAPLPRAFQGGHPLEFLPNTTQLRPGMERNASAALVAMNAAVRALAAACRKA
mmetsp:Transcript_73871/g.171346  ORF Transcript_73871/g.171346 Transcript_73871/m.171346 type:complete len:383 (-) Transcript_73871:54-1202(-)